MPEVPSVAEPEGMEEDVQPLSDSEPEVGEDLDAHDLQRYTSKQCFYFERALKEINNGRKSSCWMWYVIPTPPWIVDGVEKGSFTNREYSIRTDAQALAFLTFERDGQNLRNNYLRIMQAILKQVESGTDPVRLIGMVDYPKLISSVQYFNKICDQGVDDEIHEVTKKILPFIPPKKKKKRSNPWRFFGSSSGSDSEEDENAPFKIGDTVRLRNMKPYHRKHNGKHATITKRNKLSKLYTVKLNMLKIPNIKENQMVAPKPKPKPKAAPKKDEAKSEEKESAENSPALAPPNELGSSILGKFQKGDRVRFESALDEHLNGKLGTICGDFDTGRYPVKFIHDRETIHNVLPKFLSMLISAQKRKTEVEDMDIDAPTGANDVPE